jgi:hypothetical protein
MILWVSTNGAHFRKVALEAILRPTSFPHFVERPNELRTERAQRWRTEYKDLAEKQHLHVLATVCWIFAEAQTRVALDLALQAVADKAIAHNDLSAFQFRTATDPMEATVSYRLLGSAKTHTLTLRSKSPAQQE